MYKIYFLLIAYDLLYFINNNFNRIFLFLNKNGDKKKRRKIKKKKLILFFNFSLFMT